jgi:hypothetical protein
MMKRKGDPMRSRREPPAEPVEPIKELGLKVGEPQSIHGQTVVVVTVEGQVWSTHYTDDHDKEQVNSGTRAVEGSLDHRMLERVFASATNFDWHQQFPRRPGIPDEAVVEWHAIDRRGDKALFKAWLRDVEKDEWMGPVLAILRDVVEKVSEGRLYL